MSIVVPQLQIGTVVRISSIRLGLTNVHATVTRLNVLSIADSFFCETSDGKQFAFFGDEVETRLSSDWSFSSMRSALDTLEKTTFLEAARTGPEEDSLIHA